MMLNTFECKKCGMKCSHEQFDYTKWQRQYFDAMTPGKFNQKALECAEEHPYTGNAERL